MEKKKEKKENQDGKKEKTARRGSSRRSLSSMGTRVRALFLLFLSHRVQKWAGPVTTRTAKLCRRDSFDAIAESCWAEKIHPRGWLYLLSPRSFLFRLYLVPHRLLENLFYSLSSVYTALYLPMTQSCSNKSVEAKSSHNILLAGLGRGPVTLSCC